VRSVMLNLANKLSQCAFSIAEHYGIRNIRSQDYSFPGTFVPMMELSFSGPFVPGNIRSLDRSFHGTFVPWNCCSRYPVPFLQRTVRAFVSWAVPVLE